jgi:prolyl 4-hydroxylase
MYCHAGWPWLQGVKYSMAKWIHVGHYATGGEVLVAIEQEVHKVLKPKGACEDESDFCESWASTGECENNVAYMIGSKQLPGKCLQSCKMCHLLKEWKGEEQQQQQQGQPDGDAAAAA